MIFDLIKKFIGNYFLLLFFLILIVAFYYPFLIRGNLPLPTDTIVGMYHPYRDFYSKDYSNGIPFKNFLITDPVRQIYPWKILSIETFSKFNLPLWNPYEMSGTPLLGNFQSSIFYPLNLILFIKPFYLSWSFFIMLQTLLAGLFFYLYLKNLCLDKKAIFLGTISFTFSGFFISWLEWGTVVHTALWLPLILLSIDKLVLSFRYQVLSMSNKRLLLWSLVFIFSLVSSFFAGHLQTFFYIFILSLFYLLARWFQTGRNMKILFMFIILFITISVLTFIQWYPTLQFILLSARASDQVFTQIEGWFIPWQNLVQFIAPDFFGNPTTLNYWGIWNYAEFVGYIGIIPIVFAVFAMFSRFDKKTLFFGAITFLSLLFALPTSVAKLPYFIPIPLLSTSQPTRLIFVTCFSLSVLSAIGMDYYLKLEKPFKNIRNTIILFFLIFIFLWAYVFLGKMVFTSINIESLLISKRNLYFPTLIFITSVFIILMSTLMKRKKIRNYLIILMLILATFDLFRFSSKFETFASKEYLFPETNVISFLQRQKKPFRIASSDSRILPPNFSTFYKIESIEGYDPLYLLSFGEYIAANERRKSDISLPFGFNRIITPHNLNSKLIDLLNVKYVLSLTDISDPKYKKVLQEGQTRIYENKNLIPRIFFVEQIETVSNKKDAMDRLFSKDIDLLKTAVIEDDLPSTIEWWKKKQSIGKIKIISYTENRIEIETENDGDGFLVLTDSYYPNWNVKLYPEKGSVYKKEYKGHIYRTDFNFRGVIVPKGKYKIVFYISFFPNIFD